MEIKAETVLDLQGGRAAELGKRRAPAVERADKRDDKSFILSFGIHEEQSRAKVYLLFLPPTAIALF